MTVQTYIYIINIVYNIRRVTPAVCYCVLLLAGVHPAECTSVADEW